MCVFRASLSLAALSLASLGGCSHGVWSNQAIRESQERGNEIVEALEGYFKDQGRYPSQLDSLTPKYLSQIQEPVAGTRPWRYVTDEAGSVFDLSFGGGVHMEPVSWYCPGVPPNGPDLLPDWSVDTK